MLQIKIRKLSSLAKLPQKMTELSAGYDLFSANDFPIVIEAGKVELVPTGVAISLPAGFEAQIRPRSGLAFNHQIGILNSPGTIDADYRGEIKIILFNFGEKSFIVEPHYRIAQMVISKHENVSFVLTDDLEETSRGEGGFGHTSL
jgi:dUTP pyrophosphatase